MDCGFDGSESRAGLPLFWREVQLADDRRRANFEIAINWIRRRNVNPRSTLTTRGSKAA